LVIKLFLNTYADQMHNLSMCHTAIITSTIFRAKWDLKRSRNKPLHFWHMCGPVPQQCSRPSVAQAASHIPPGNIFNSTHQTNLSRKTPHFTALALWKHATFCGNSWTDFLNFTRPIPMFYQCKVIECFVLDWGRPNNWHYKAYFNVCGILEHIYHQLTANQTQL